MWIRRRPLFLGGQIVVPEGLGQSAFFCAERGEESRRPCRAHGAVDRAEDARAEGERDARPRNVALGQVAGDEGELRRAPDLGDGGEEGLAARRLHR